MKSLNLDKIKAALERVPEQFGDLVAQVGFPKGHAYPDGTSVAYVATIHEFGAPEQGIPARPFVQPAVRANKDDWVALMAIGIKQVQDGKESAFDALERVGLQAAGDVKTSLANVWSPPVKEATMRNRKVAKGNPKPLDDTGQMMATINHSVAHSGDDFIA